MFYISYVYACNINLLIVEDSQVPLKIFKKIIEKQYPWIHVTASIDGKRDEQGKDIHESFVDKKVIVLDYNLVDPKVTGGNILKEIRTSSDEKIRDIYVLGYSMDNNDKFDNDIKKYSVEKNVSLKGLDAKVDKNAKEGIDLIVEYVCSTICKDVSDKECAPSRKKSSELTTGSNTTNCGTSEAPLEVQKSGINDIQKATSTAEKK